MTNKTFPNSFSQNSRRGAAMLFAIFALLVVGTTTLAFTASRHTHFLSSRNVVNSIRVRELADSGLDVAKAILRSDTTSWRTLHSNGKLLNNYALDGGTVTVALIDIELRDAGNSAADSTPTSETKEVEITVTANRDGATWTSVSNMGIATTTKGQYGIFVKKFLRIKTDQNQVGRWERAPLSSEKRRVNLGSMAAFGNKTDSGSENFSGVWLGSGVQFETDALPVDPSDPRTLKSTWVYYPYEGGADLLIDKFAVNGPGRDLVSVVRMNPEDFIGMPTLPAIVAAVPAQPAFSPSSNTISSGTRTLTPFRIGTPNSNSNKDFTTGTCTLTFTTGTYEIYGQWIANNTTIYIQGAVKFIVYPNKTNSGNQNNGVEWTNTTVQLLAGADLQIHNGYGLKMTNCWIGSDYTCESEPDSAKAKGDPHMKKWKGLTFQQTACDTIAPEEPRYFEPWHVSINAIVTSATGNSTSQGWTFTDTSVIGSLFLPDNTIEMKGKSQLYGRIAAFKASFIDSSHFRYDHALDDVAGLTTGRLPNRGSNPNETYAIRLLRWGPDKGTGP